MSVKRSGSTVDREGNQSRFKMALLMRDGWCLATGREANTNIAAHIVPFNRPDVCHYFSPSQGSPTRLTVYHGPLATQLYSMLLGPENGASLFAMSMGLLLGPTEHKSFDCLEWAFFPRVSAIPCLSVESYFNTHPPVDYPRNTTWSCTSSTPTTRTSPSFTDVSCLTLGSGSTTLQTGPIAASSTFNTDNACRCFCGSTLTGSLSTTFVNR